MCTEDLAIASYSMQLCLNGRKIAIAIVSSLIYNIANIYTIASCLTFPDVKQQDGDSDFGLYAFAPCGR